MQKKPKKELKESFTLRLYPSLRTRLEAEAKSQCRSASAQVEFILEAHYAQTKETT